MEFVESDDFKREFKKLKKKYPTLEDDLEVVKKAIKATPTGNGTKHWNILKTDNSHCYILKMRMMCRAVRGSQFRIVYCYNEKNIEILFIELYFKSNKVNEDRQRIDDVIKELEERGDWST